LCRGHEGGSCNEQIIKNVKRGAAGKVKPKLTPKPKPNPKPIPTNTPGVPMHTTKIDPNETNCVVQDCTEQATFRNLCDTHRKDPKRTQENDSMLVRARVKRYCTEDDCGSRRHTAGLCKKHFKQSGSKE
jgi:hypothetical protein